MRKKVKRKVAKGKISTSQNSKVATSQNRKVVTSQSGKVATSQSSKVATSQSSNIAKWQGGRVKSLGGRPTKYYPAIIEDIGGYLEWCKTEGKIPTREGFAGSIGVIAETLKEWEHAKPVFSAAIKKLDDNQKLFLMENALNGTKKEATSIFLLKANHGMMETSRQEITGKDGKDLNINITAFTGGNVTKQLPTIEGEVVE